MTNHEVSAYWSGSWPCLCHGEWTLIIDGENKSNLIPEGIRKENMDTKGSYEHWAFDDNYVEQWWSEEDGLDESDWIRENDSWLSKITYDYELKGSIFKAFQLKDWRHGSCGGCI